MRCAFTLTLIVGSCLGQQILEVNEAIGYFSVRMLKITQMGDDNSIFSAFSISSAMGMCLLGAKDQTQSQIQQTLGFGNASLSDIQEGYKQSSRSIAVMTGSPGSDGFVLSQANRLYANKSQSPSEEFQHAVEDTFDAQVEVVDFLEQDETRNAINKFVKRQTSGLIPELLEKPLDTGTILALVNAFYFRGSWQKRFERVNLTIPFKGASSSGAGAPQWMNATTSYNSGHSDAIAATLIEIPYVGNPNTTNTTSMVIIMPDSENITSWLGTHVTWGKLEGAIRDLNSTYIQLTIPQFRVESSFDLGSILAEMGMSLAFTTDADFGNMYDDAVLGRSVQISKVIHKAKITVDEKGTEAAAASAVAIEPSSVVEGPVKTLIIDRPFLALVVLEGSGSRVPLFTCVISKV